MKKTHHYLPPRLAITILALWVGSRSYAAENIKDAQNTEKVAENVKQKAQAAEKAEGSQDLVKDKVSVKQSAGGKPVIEQTGEASSYGQGFHGKTPAMVKNSIRTI